MDSFGLIVQVPGSQDVDEVGDESLRKIARSGKGLVLLLAHIGSV